LQANPSPFRRGPRRYAPAMARVRFGVVLLAPPPFDREIDGLRRALDDSHFGQVAPHLTLVPPVNVRVDDIPLALRVLRDAAASMARQPNLELVLGPPTSFRPATETLYLEVSGPDNENNDAAPSDSMAALHELRRRIFVPPFERTLEWPFVPHVTMAEGIDGARIDAAVSVLAGYRITVSFDRVHLLQERRDADGHRRWDPVADARFAPPAVVGRGGVELELTSSQLLDPEVLALLDGQQPQPQRQPRPQPVAEVVAPATTSATGWLGGSAGGGGASAGPVGSTRLVVCARRRGELVGVAVGWVRGDERELVHLEVVEPHRGQGIGRQLQLAFAVAVP
jgi:2'-5' RNA ligase